MDEQSDDSREAVESDNEVASEQEDAGSEVCRSDQNPASPSVSEIGSPQSPDKNEPEQGDSEAEVQRSEPDEEEVQSEKAERSDKEESEDEVEHEATESQHLESEEDVARKSDSEEDGEREVQSDHEGSVNNRVSDQEEETPASPTSPSTPASQGMQASPTSPVSPASPSPPASPTSPAQMSDDEVEREEPEGRESPGAQDKEEGIHSDMDDRQSEVDDVQSDADDRQSEAGDRQSVDGRQMEGGEKQSDDDRQSEASEREIQRDQDDDDEEVHRSPATPDSDAEVEMQQKVDSDAEVRSPSPVEPSQEKSSSESEQSDSDDDRDDSEDESKVGELIADIFGESDEDEEFEGFGEQDVEAAKKKKLTKKRVLSDSEDDDKKKVDVEQLEEQDQKAIISDDDKELEPEEREVEEPRSPVEELPKEKPKTADSSDDEMDNLKKRHLPDDFVSDFDLMLERKKEGQRKRKTKNVDIISDSDDLIADIITNMKQAAEEDRQLNKNRMAATKKLKMLPLVLSQLRKHDLKIVFLDQGVLNVMTDWLLPLPDRALPHLHIREAMLRLLAEFPPIDQSLLKSSGIGRAVMYLYKHPRETKENRERAGRLISEWSRPIFNLNANYSSISKEEREHRDFEHMPRKRKLRLNTGEDGIENKDIDRALSGEEKALRPGEKGWISRARVPMPSTRDYVVRPKWNVETEFRSRSSSRKQQTRLERQVRSLREKKLKNRMQRAVTISIEGRKMAL